MVIDANEFRGLLINSYNFINETRLEEALTFYFPIIKFAETNKIDPDLIEMFGIYRDTMILYITLKQGSILANDKEMEWLKEKIDYVYFNKKLLMPRLKSEKLVNYLNESYHYVLGLYMYNFYKKKFMQEFENIYYFLHAGWTEKALNHYQNHLLKYYNKLVNYGDYRVRNTLYTAITNLKREIKMVSLKQQAYSEIASYTFTGIKREKHKEKVIRVQRSINPITTIKFDKKQFNKLRKSIKEDNSEEALNLYKNLLHQNI